VTQHRHLFLTLPRFDLRVPELHGAFARLRGSSPLPLVTVAAYLNRPANTALLELRFERRSLTPAQISELVVWACGEGLPLLDPGSLPSERREQFYRDFLPSFEPLPVPFSGPLAALFALARQAGNGAPERFAEATLLASGSVIRHHDRSPTS
jgi:hypothetical protein